MPLSLTLEEEHMLSGDYGSGVQKSMDLLVQIGEAFGAERMVEISSSHLIPYEIMSASRFGVPPAKWFEDWVLEMTEGVSSFRVVTTINPAIVNPQRAIELGFKELGEIDPTESVIKGMEKYKRMGAIPVYTCCPFLIFTPRKGEHLGGAESVAVAFYNTFFGAKVNRESGPTALAAAVTGRVPEFGMHHLDSRYGQLLVEINRGLDSNKFTYADYNALAYYVGEKAQGRIPVFYGLSQNLNVTQIKYLCAPLGVSAGLPMCHIVGVTPEAPTVEIALGGRRAEDKIEFGVEQLQEAYRQLTTANDERVDAVTIGCPHATLQELGECAQLLGGEKVSPKVKLWVGTAETIRFIGERMGYVKAIEDAGGFVVTDMCAHSYSYCRGAFSRKHALGTVATNSAKAAHYIQIIGSAKTWFGSTEQCIKAAISGRWQ